MDGYLQNVCVAVWLFEALFIGGVVEVGQEIVTLPAGLNADVALAAPHHPAHVPRRPRRLVVHHGRPADLVLVLRVTC